MQSKRLSDMLHLSGPLQLLWNRISFSRLTLFYFAFSVAHFIIQLSLQIRAFTINADAASFLFRIVNEAQTTSNSLPILQGSTLRMCSWVPSSLNVDVASCPVVWSGDSTASAGVLNGAFINPTGDASDTYSSVSSTPTSAPSSSLSQPAPSPSVLKAIVTSSSTVSSALSTSSTLSSASVTSSARPQTTTTSTTAVRQTVTVFVAAKAAPTGTVFEVDEDDDDDDKEEDEDDRRRSNIRRDVQVIPSRQGGNTSVTLVGLEAGQDVVLDDTCLWSLNWPVSILDNTKREDIVFIAFQFWVLGMSIVALLNESIPHIIASLLTHMLATAWAAFQITHTANFRANFTRVITNGTCKNAPLLPHYWAARSNAEIPSLVLNVVALFFSCFLTWKLIKLFGWQTFKRVGASLTINRIYKLVLTLSITIQLSMFFMVVTVSLWIDQLMNSVIGDLVDFLKLYKASSFITLALLVPWLTSGWFGVRRELRMPMFIFLMLSVLYLGGWGVMFFSTTFRWTFITWRFFSIMASASVLLTCLSIILGVICRFNFGKGLARHLNAQQALPDDDYEPYGGDDIEKVAFPSSEEPLPTYTSYNEREFTRSTYSTSTLGPRFSDPNAEPFETSIPGLAYPAPTLTRSSSDAQIQRSDSGGSKNSFSYSSGSSGNSHLRNDSSHSQPKRWVIE